MTVMKSLTQKFRRNLLDAFLKRNMLEIGLLPAILEWLVVVCQTTLVIMMLSKIPVNKLGEFYLLLSFPFTTQEFNCESNNRKRERKRDKDRKHEQNLIYSSAHSVFRRHST